MNDNPLASHDDDNVYSQVKLLLEREKDLSATKLRLEHINSRNLSLQQISQFLITNQIMDEGLRHATRALVIEMSFEKSFLVLRTDGTLSVMTHCGYAQAQKEQIEALSPDSLERMFAVVAATDKGEFVDTPEQRARFEQSLLDTIDLLTFLIAPLREGDKIIGFLVAGYSAAQEASYRENLLLSEQDSLWFSALANQMSSMIINARLIASLQEYAHKLDGLTDELALANQGLEKKVRQRTDQLTKNVAELTAAKAKDAAIFASMGEGLVVTDTAGIVLLMNGIVEDMFELEPGTSIGKHMIDVMKLGDEQGTAITNDVFTLMQSPPEGEPSIRTFSFTGKEDRKMLVDIAVTPIIQKGAEADTAETIGAVAIVRDITKEKEIDRMKTEFISLASHQLRTPLSAIKWFSEMLAAGDAGPLNPSQAEFSQNIASAARRMIELVNSLLNISRIESGRIIVDPKPTDLKELVTGVVNDLAAKIEERHQNLTITVHDDLPQVSLDPQLIGQVYLNLLTNAIKYTPMQGTISVSISREGEEIVSQVTDSGYGIPKAQQGRMFQKFFRAENITKIEADGTGLGMYLVKAIIESSGGKIWFESTENKGTTFWFSLPLSGMQAREGEVSLDTSM